jgi:hypothetical protein
VSTNVAWNINCWFSFITFSICHTKNNYRRKRKLFIFAKKVPKRELTDRKKLLTTCKKWRRKKRMKEKKRKREQK